MTLVGVEQAEAVHPVQVKVVDQVRVPATDDTVR